MDKAQINPKIAVAISTRNRTEEFLESIVHWACTDYDNIEFFVVDDASSEPYVDKAYRFDQRAGIPRVKNKCLELAYNSGAEHIFLADDDIYPKSKDWYAPYVNSGEHHLSFCFEESYGSTPRRHKLGITADEKFAIYSGGNGCLMYFSRHCVETIGGYDEQFGLGYYEHNDLSRRIHNAGLTRFLYMDVANSKDLFYSMDQHGTVERNSSTEERELQIRANMAYFESKRLSSEFIEFRK
jgi:glycosyltransferase involved in cell wall biosynthesis